jgi:hypothetical protein
VFSHLIARRPGTPPSGDAPAQPAQAASTRVRARAAARPFIAVLACAAAVTIAGCKPGLVSGASSGGTPSSGAAPTSSGNAQSASSAASAMTAMAHNAQGVGSFVATLQVRATGKGAAHLSGVLIEQTQPTLLVDVRATRPAGLEAVLTGSTAYLKIGALTRVAGRPWVAVPYSSLATGSNASLTPTIQQMQGSNPLAQAQMFPAATNVRAVGRATVNGVATTQYNGSYSIAAGLAQLAGSLRSAVRSSMMASGITSTRFSVWVDARHQVRKMSLVEIGRSTKIQVVLVIISVNRLVQIQVPAASLIAGATTPSRAAAPAPAMTTAPSPAMTTVPAPTPGITVTPAPGTSGTPAPQPSTWPTHW